MFSAAATSLCSIFFWFCGVLFPSSLSCSCLVPCWHQDPAQPLPWNRSSHSHQLLQFHALWSMVLFLKPWLLDAFSLLKKREQLHFSNTQFYFSKARGWRRVWKHCESTAHAFYRYHNQNVDTACNPEVSHSFKTFLWGTSWTKMMLFAFYCQWELMDSKRCPILQQISTTMEIVFQLTSSSVFLCCLCTTVNQPVRELPTFSFPWSLRNSATTCCRLLQHLPSTSPCPCHKRKES